MRPSLDYLLFVRNQARILGRRAQRSGLHERARHHRLQQDWAEDQIREWDEEWQAEIRLSQELLRQHNPSWRMV